MDGVLVWSYPTTTKILIIIHGIPCFTRLELWQQGAAECRSPAEAPVFARKPHLGRVTELVRLCVPPWPARRLLSCGRNNPNLRHSLWLLQPVALHVQPPAVRVLAAGDQVFTRDAAVAVPQGRVPERESDGVMDRAPHHRRRPPHLHPPSPSPLLQRGFTTLDHILNLRPFLSKEAPITGESNVCGFQESLRHYSNERVFEKKVKRKENVEKKHRKWYIFATKIHIRWSILNQEFVSHIKCMWT